MDNSKVENINSINNLDYKSIISNNNLDYKSIISNNNDLYLSGFSSDKEKEYYIDDEYVKDSFKYSILSNLKLFYNSNLHNQNCFIIFSGIPIENFVVQNRIIKSDNYPYFGKLLFEAFIEEIERYENNNENTDELIQYFFLNFIGENKIYHNINEDFLYDNNGDVIGLAKDKNNFFKPNNYNLFNYLSPIEQVKILNKLSNNEKTYFNIARVLKMEFLLLFNQYSNESIDSMFNYYEGLGDVELAQFSGLLIQIISNLELEQSIKNLNYFSEKLKNSSNNFIQYLGKLINTYTLGGGENNQEIVKHINLSHVTDNDVYCNVNFGFSKPIIPHRASKDYVFGINQLGKIEGYGKYNEKYNTFNAEKYIQFNTLTLLNNIENGEDVNELIFYFLEEVDYSITKSSENETFNYISKFLGENNNQLIKKIIKEENIDENLEKLKNNLINGYFNIEEPDVETIEKEDIKDVIEKEGNINIFGNLNTCNVGDILELFHSSGLIEIINYELGIDLKNLTLQIQTHLLNFLWTKTSKDFEDFKHALNTIENEEDKYNFLNTFLACSEDIGFGDIIIELSKQEGTEEIFKMYSQLVNLQTEIKSDDIDLMTFLKVILKKGKNLLKKDLKNINKDDFVGLVKFGALIKGLYNGLKNGGELMGISEFNNIGSGYTLDLIKGGNLLKNTDSLSMINENNYKFRNKLSKKDFDFVISSIKKAHTNYDPNFINFAMKYMPLDFNNPNSNFIFLRDEKKDLVGVCKIEIKENGTCYYGTHYLKEELKGDFSLGVIIQKILEKELNISGELNGYTILGNNETILRQIEFSGGIGNEIKNYKLGDYESKVFLGFLLNSKINYTTKNKDLKTEADFKSLNSDCIKIEIFNNISDDNFTKGCKSEFEKGYFLTRIIQENGKFLTVFEKIN